MMCDSSCTGYGRFWCRLWYCGCNCCGCVLFHVICLFLGASENCVLFVSMYIVKKHFHIDEPSTYKYLVKSSMSTNIESWLMCRSSRSIKNCTKFSFSRSICVCNSFTMTCSWAMFMSVSICRETRRFSGDNDSPTL